MINKNCPKLMCENAHGNACPSCYGAQLQYYWCKTSRSRKITLRPNPILKDGVCSKVGKILIDCSHCKFK